MSAGAIAGGVIGGIFGFFLIIYFLCGILTVREKEVVIIESFGKYKEVLTAGVHFIWPCIEKPRYYPVRYVVDYQHYNTIVEKNDFRISLQHEVLDFPAQQVITRDNAKIQLDAVLSYQLLSPSSARTMVYSVNNLPMVLSRLLQAHIRNVAATLDVDQIIEDSAAMNVLTPLLNDTAMRWGVRVNFVKIQRVDANELSADLAKKKNADLTNKNVIITAKSTKQTTVLAAEGVRDQMVKTAEGEAQKLISIAQGRASAIINEVTAEADALRKIIPVLQSRGEDPVRYVMNQRYMTTFENGLLNSEVKYVPEELSDLVTFNKMGVLLTEQSHKLQSTPKIFKQQ